LAAKGILQPIWPKEFRRCGASRILAVYGQGFAPEDDGQQRLGLTTQVAYDTLCGGLELALAAEIAKRGNGVWVLSNEHLHSRLKTQAQVQRLAGLLKPHFSEITVHVHLRPQVDIARSISSTMARLGHKVSKNIFDLVVPGSAYYDFAMLVARWESVFGAAQVRVIPYKRVPSIRQYFFDLWQLDATDFGPELSENRSVDWRIMALVNALHPHRGRLLDARRLQKVIEEMPAGPALQIGLARAQEITARMQASNEALVRARPELTMDDFTPDWAAYDHPENLSSITAECVFSAQIAEMISEMQAELLLEKARSQILQAEKFFVAGQKRQANEKLDIASALLLRIEPLWGERDIFNKMRNYMAKVVLDGLA